MNALCYHDKPNIHVKLVFSSLWNHLNESYDHLKSTCKKVSPAFCQAESWLFPPAYPAVSVGRRGGSVSSCREHWCSATSPTCHPIGPVLALYGDWQMDALALLKSITISLVLVVLSGRQLPVHQSLKASPRFLYLCSCPLLIHVTITVSSQYFCMYLKSAVYSVNMNGAKTGHCAPAVSHLTVPETQLTSLTNWGHTNSLLPRTSGRDPHPTPPIWEAGVCPKH